MRVRSVLGFNVEVSLTGDDCALLAEACEKVSVEMCGQGQENDSQRLESMATAFMAMAMVTCAQTNWAPDDLAAYQADLADIGVTLDEHGAVSLERPTTPIARDEALEQAETIKEVGVGFLGKRT
jgi:hypothetical protein